jgi:hypothetical protein
MPCVFATRGDAEVSCMVGAMTVCAEEALVRLGPHNQSCACVCADARSLFCTTLKEIGFLSDTFEHGGRHEIRIFNHLLDRQLEVVEVSAKCIDKCHSFDLVPVDGPHHGHPFVDCFDFLDGVLDAVSLTEVHVVQVHDAIALGPGAKSNIAIMKEVENICSRVEARNFIAIGNTNVLLNKSAERSVV